MKFLMGNEIIALGAIAAGVRFVSGYPGTPSTEILENVAKHNTGDIYVEWSVNEKVAMEVAVGAAYSGARALVTMKQVGLNVASDPLMSLAYIGIKGGMVIVVADDPGPISSQTEQDTRHFAQYSKLPIFDPSSPEESYTMIEEAFEYSEKYQTPVLFRPTTRICHGCTAIEIKKPRKHKPIEGFIKDSKWVIFPRLAYMNHLKIEKRNVALGKEFSRTNLNTIDWQKTPSSDSHIEKTSDNSKIKRAIITGGVSYEYVREALVLLETQCTVLKVGTPHPFPEDLACDLIYGVGDCSDASQNGQNLQEQVVDEVLVIEELDPVLEKEMLCLVGKKLSSTKIFGKLTGHIAQAGENSVESVKEALAKFLKFSCGQKDCSKNLDIQKPELPPLPIRPPVLCAGCPHRASFYAVKHAMKGKKAVFSGDIGCYTLGNAAPLDMVDTCLCMGASITIAQGMNRTVSMEVAYNMKNAIHSSGISALEAVNVQDKNSEIKPLTEVGTNFAFIGDSTFFHTGIAGLVNAVYNKHNFVLVVLDNATTAMTGHQPHPGTGKTLMDKHHTLASVETIAQKVSIEKVLTAIGIEFVQSVDPLDFYKAVEAAQLASEYANSGKGVSAIIYKSPCIAIIKPCDVSIVDTQKCIGCKKCVQHLGCPAIVLSTQNNDAHNKESENDKVKAKNGKVRIEASLCYGCGLCHYVCPVGAISKVILAQKEVR